MSSELIRLVDGIARDKKIDRESVLVDLEAAMASAARKQFMEAEDVQVMIDRESGEITAALDGEPLDIRKLGRIPAQTAKQVMIQKLREDERGAYLRSIRIVLVRSWQVRWRVMRAGRRL